MVRKVMAGEQLPRAAGTVTTRLTRWLADNAHLDVAAASEAAGLGAKAVRDLPRAERLSSILFDHAAKIDVDIDVVGHDDVIEDYLLIERVERGAIWFQEGIGPVKVPREASELAQPGWSASVTLARVGGSWHLVEVGNVYPCRSWRAGAVSPQPILY